MDMRKFHDRIDGVAALHLGAIQVLGHVLGIGGGTSTIHSPFSRPHAP
jgi:hypothetical protein